jgi:hypothetical protein
MDGISVGLWPTRGPRGLFRIYAPYLGQARLRSVNFVSIEPVVNGVRGQSELEKGMESGKTGLSMTSGDTLEAALKGDERNPAQGRIEKIDGKEALTFFVATERFRNGAHPVIQVVLRKDRPEEIGFRIFAAPDSAPMTSCVLSATMGNYGRLRKLWLRNHVATAGELWPQFVADPLGFAPWRQFSARDLLRKANQVIVAASPDEADLAGAKYGADVPMNWHYTGKPATHYWRTEAEPGVVARVNGRTTYWRNNGRIPGGVAYENFEMEAPFKSGQTFWFGVTPEKPESLGFKSP